MADDSSKHLIAKQFRLLSSNDDFSCDLIDKNIFEWKIIIPGPSDTPFSGGYFPARLSFPQDFPLSPPKLTFLTREFFHPNVYPDGVVCISILHEPKHDPFNEQELLSEKWRPIFGVEGILISIISILAEPNISSPANVDAAVLFKNDPESYKRKIRALVRRSNEDLANGL